jgi:hypothetical protein
MKVVSTTAESLVSITSNEGELGNDGEHQKRKCVACAVAGINKSYERLCQWDVNEQITFRNKFEFANNVWTTRIQLQKKTAIVNKKKYMQWWYFSQWRDWSNFDSWFS